MVYLSLFFWFRKSLLYNYSELPVWLTRSDAYSLDNLNIWAQFLKALLGLLGKSNFTTLAVSRWFSGMHWETVTSSFSLHMLIFFPQKNQQLKRSGWGKNKLVPQLVPLSAMKLESVTADGLIPSLHAPDLVILKHLRFMKFTYSLRVQNTITHF